MNKPIKKFKSGSIEASVWNNQRDTQNGKVEFKTISLRRSWKDGDQWRDQTINLRKNDIVKMMLVLQKAQEELFLTDNEEED